MQGLVFSLLQICILLYKVQVYKLLITLVPQIFAENGETSVISTGKERDPVC